MQTLCKVRISELTFLIINFFKINVIFLRKPDEKVHYEDFQILPGVEIEEKKFDMNLSLCY